MTKTCVKVLHKGYIITCLYRMNARLEGGDSGAPVFYWDAPSDNVSLAGIVFGHPYKSNKAYFSALGSIELEIGAMQTANPNP